MDYAVQNLRALRTAQRLSKRELAEAATERGSAMYTTTITRLESGKSPMKLSDAMVFADIFGVSLQRFATEPVDDPTSARLLQLRNEAERQEAKVFRELTAYLDAVSSLRSVVSQQQSSSKLRRAILGEGASSEAKAGNLDSIQFRSCSHWLNMPLRVSWLEKLSGAYANYGEYVVETEDR